MLAQGRGAILVTGHFGNWEIGSVLMSRVLHLPLTIVAMAEASADVNRVRREIRDRLGVETIEVRQSLHTALQIRRRLSDNGIVAMLMDRHLGRDRVQVTLLGRPAWFLRTPALMGYLSGAPLMPCFIQRTESHPAFSVFLGDPIAVAADRPRDEAIQQATQQFADQLSARDPAASRVLVSVLSILGRTAGFLRGPRLVGLQAGSRCRVYGSVRL